MSEFTSVRRVTARKEHRCADCGQPIKPGEKYDRVAGMNYEFGFGAYKTHAYRGMCSIWAEEDLQPHDSGSEHSAASGR